MRQQGHPHAAHFLSWDEATVPNQASPNCATSEHLAAWPSTLLQVGRSTAMHLLFLPLFACGLFFAQVQCIVLSDLPTPSFVVDIGALRKAYHLPAETIPSLHLPKHGMTLFPLLDTAAADARFRTPKIDVTFDFSQGDSAIGYLHSSVIRSREDAIPGKDDPIETFLAELDLSPSLTDVITGTKSNDKASSPKAESGARLVLGLNNHHVGSYYWARSAGSGASMEAPGICFGDKCNDRGVLRWEKDGGPAECNSNDGKRSEWVNFLRRQDTVQLLPLAGQDCLLRFVERFGQVLAHKRSTSISMSAGRQSARVFGVTSEGRPLGSDPELVCEWVPM